MDSLNDCFRFILTKGALLKKDKCSRKNDLYAVVQTDIPKILKAFFKMIDYHEYYLKASAGSGSWSIVPYVALLDPILSKGFNGCSASIGIYPAYLISSDCSRIYLVYMIGVGGKSEEKIYETVTGLREKIDYSPFDDNVENMELGDDRKHYRAGTIFFVEYSKENLPEEKKILEDLAMFINIHKDVVFRIKQKNNLL